MRKLIVKFVCAFIPNKKLRHKIRDKYSYSYKTILLNKLNYIENLIKATHDITNVPVAKGNIRLQQLASAKLLDLINSICEKHNITYWIHYGTLLGSIRHNGFIPWDDDIDIAMQRTDYEKFIKLITKLLKNTDFHFGVDGFVKICYKDCPVWVDIFPFDNYYKQIKTKEETHTLKKDCDTARSHFHYKVIKKEHKFYELRQCKKTYEEIRNLSDTIVMKNNPPAKNGDMFLGIDCWVLDNVIYKPEEIFPLKEYEFEGYKFKGPNNYHSVLQKYYGDFYSFPPDITPIHTNYTHFNVTNIKDMENFLQLDNKKILKTLLK